jgi:hypothetical protein
LNTSTAWTEHLERTSTYQTASDDEKEANVKGKPARALYDFEGKAEFRELLVSIPSLCLYRSMLWRDIMECHQISILTSNITGL